MKKFIAFNLALVILLLSFVGCDFKQDDDENSESEGTESTTADVSNLMPFPLFEKDGVVFWYKGEGKYTVYIKEWGRYEEIEPVNGVYYTPTTAARVGEDTAEIAFFIQTSKHGGTLITYQLNRNAEEVQVNSVVLEIKYLGESEYSWFKLYEGGNACFFCMPSRFSDHDAEYFPIVRYETTDGGKTWNVANVFYFDGYPWNASPEITFVTEEVGVITYRYITATDLCYRTYITTDGGFTWNRISNLPYPFDLDEVNGYTEIESFEKAKDSNTYILRVKVIVNSYQVGDSEIGFFSLYLEFYSDDLVDWRLH